MDFAPKTQNNQLNSAKPAHATSTNTPEASTTDNSQPVAQYEPAKEPPKTFESTLAEKKVTKNSQDPPETKESIKKSPDQDGSDVVVPDASEKLLITVAQLKKGEDLPLQQISIAAKKTVIVDKAVTSNSTKALETETPENQQSGKELTPQTLSGGTKTPITEASAVGALASEQKPEASAVGALVSEQKPEAPAVGVLVSEQKPEVPVANIQTPASKDAVNVPVQEAATSNEPKVQQLSEKITSDTTIEKPVPPNEQHQQDASETKPLKTTFAIPKDQTNSLPDQKTPDSSTGNGQNAQDTKSELFEMPEKTQTKQPNIPDASSAKDVTVTQVQASVSKTEKTGDLLPGQGTNSGVELPDQLITDNNVQSSSTQRSPMLAASAKTAQNTNFDATISQQIQESVQTTLKSSNQQIVIRLNPPELGNVAIKFQEQGNEITGLLQVDRPQTKLQIQQALPEIIQNLQDAGVQIKKVEVVLANQQEQYSTKDQSSAQGQGTFAGQQNAPDQQYHSSNPAYNEWLTNTESYTGFTEHNLQLTDTSINMLV